MEWGAWNLDRGIGNGEVGIGGWERGSMNGERVVKVAASDERQGNGKREVGGR